MLECAHFPRQLQPHPEEQKVNLHELEQNFHAYCVSRATLSSLNSMMLTV